MISKQKTRSSNYAGGVRWSPRNLSGAVTKGSNLSIRVCGCIVMQNWQIRRDTVLCLRLQNLLTKTLYKPLCMSKSWFLSIGTVIYLRLQFLGPHARSSLLFLRQFQSRTQNLRSLRSPTADQRRWNSLSDWLMGSSRLSSHFESFVRSVQRIRCKHLVNVRIYVRDVF